MGKPQLRAAMPAISLRCAAQVARPRLVRCFPQLLTHRLTFIQAPAGYGKTALLGEAARWLKARGETVTLLSAGAHHTEHVERAIRKREVEAEADGRHDASFYLLIDDAHLLLGEAALTLLKRLPEQLTPKIHLVVTSRVPLELGIARLRGRGDVFELHLEDLAFDPVEAGAFMESLNGSPPEESELATMLSATRGWPAALRLLCSTGSRDSVFALIEEEVLRPLDRSALDALELLAISERTCASLVATLRGEPEDAREGRDIARAAVARGLFLTPRIDAANWYAMHPLVREYLCRRLAERDPGRSRWLHRTASTWFETQGLFPEALDHAVQADDPEAAARIFDSHGEDFYAAGLEQSILPCANRLPAALCARYPRILMAVSWRLQAELQPDKSRELLRTARTRIDELAESGDCPPAELRQFRNQLLHRVITQAQCEGDFAFVLEWSHILLARYTDASPYVRCSLYGAMLQAQREHYELSQLVRFEELARTQLEQVESRYVQVFLDALAAPGRLISGRIDALIQALERSLVLASDISGERSALGAVVALPLAEAWLERGERARARALLDDYLPRASETGFEDQLISGWLTDAQLLRDSGDGAAALARLDETIRFASARGLQRLRTIAIACAMEFHCSLGDRDAAAGLATTIGLKRLAPPDMPDGRITRTECARAMAWTRLAVTRGHHNAALALARRWRARLASAGAVRDRVRWEVRIALLQSATGDERAARRSLHQALIAGSPGRLLRPFVEDAELIAHLLPAPADAGTNVDFQSRFADEVRTAVKRATGIGTQPQPAEIDSHVAVDGLSQREVEILQLVGTGMLNGEVGNQLGLTEGSVKWYLQRIFDKVGTRRRLLAVDYARRRGLLS